MIINMKDEYGTRGNPTVKVDVLSVTRSHKEDTVVWMSRYSGEIRFTKPDGHMVEGESSSNDLVPLQKKQECWVVFIDGNSSCFEFEEQAREWVGVYGGKIVHVVEPD